MYLFFCQTEERKACGGAAVDNKGAIKTMLVLLFSFTVWAQLKRYLLPLCALNRAFISPEQCDHETDGYRERNAHREFI